jgi:hypothetical protein
MCIPIARQRVGKHIPGGAYARNITPIARQCISQLAFSKIERLVPCVVHAEELAMKKVV